MRNKLASFFLKESSYIFEFLVTDYSFRKPKLEMDSKINFVSVVFFRKDIAFECIFDEREKDVTCKITKVVNEKKVDCFAVNDKGERVRDDVAAILRRKGIRERLFTKLNKQTKIEEMIQTVLLDYAEMLKKYDQDLLNNPVSIFE